jgi:hypothetical protein
VTQEAVDGEDCGERRGSVVWRGDEVEPEEIGVKRVGLDAPDDEIMTKIVLEFAPRTSRSSVAI